MKKLFKILMVIILLVVSGLIAVLLLTSGDRKIAKEFVTGCCGSQTNDFAWYELMHDALKKEVDKGKFTEMFEASQSYETVSFTSSSKEGSSASFEGSATTKSNCTSKVAIEVLASKIISFEITPLCPK